MLVVSFTRHKAPDMLLVAEGHGRITHITGNLAGLLGYDVPTLLAARTPLVSLLAQPWAQLMIPQWAKPASPSPIHGFRHRNGDAQGQAEGWLVQLTGPSKPALPVRLQVTPREDNGQPVLVLVAHKTTVEAGLDLRRLRVQVGINGLRHTSGRSKQSSDQGINQMRPAAP